MKEIISYVTYNLIISKEKYLTLINLPESFIRDAHFKVLENFYEEEFVYWYNIAKEYCIVQEEAS